MARIFKAKLQEVIEKAISDNCFEYTSEKVSHIEDLGENQKCSFTNNAIDTFKITNQTNAEICLLSVDGCWFKSDDDSRCDGIVFNNREICFFELKLNAVSNRNKTKKENFKKAVSQLESTINFIKESFVAKNLKIEHTMQAFVCMRPKSYPNNTATISQKRVEFLEKNSIPLFPENEKIFRY
jgi:hypothetical protein